MRKWVTIGDYEGEAIIEDIPLGNGNGKTEQRLETCVEENGSSGPPSCESDPLGDVSNKKVKDDSDRFVASKEAEPHESDVSETGKLPASVNGHESDVKKSNEVIDKRCEVKPKGTESESVKVNGSATDSESKNKLASKWKLVGSNSGKVKDSWSILNGISSKVSKSKSDGENCDGAMDVELPTPEHITSFYDLVKAVKNSNENLSAQEIENKFKQLSLAFKTDRLTLRQRLDVQHRQRDTAEANFERELDQLRKSILSLHEDCLDTDLVDAIMQVRKHVDVLTTSSSSLLSASEVWGAVQQEWRVSRALEVLLLHVENVNRLYENDHQELEEMRKVLQENQIEYPAGSSASLLSSAGDLEGANRRGRAFSVAALSKQTSENGNRRISLGPGAAKSVLNQFLNTRSSRRRLSLMPDLRPFHQELAKSVEKAVAAKAQENKEEKSGSNMMRSSITEEGRESGDEDSDRAGKDNTSSSPTATTLRTLAHYPLYTQSMEDTSDMSYEENNTSHPHSQVTDTLLPNNATGCLSTHPQNWLLQCIQELLRNYRTGNWPYTNQQILRGVFTSFLLIVAVFCLIIAATSADEGLLEPRCPDWSIFVKHNGVRPI